MVRAMRELGRAVFIKSQAYVPFQTGALRDSGTYTEIPGGFRIRYKAKYAARREYGIEPGRRITVRRHRVGGFVGPMGRRVGGFMRGPYTYVTRGEPGSHYLQRAIDEEQPTFGRRLARHLRTLLKK
jgi:hypothetical protein